MQRYTVIEAARDADRTLRQAWKQSEAETISYVPEKEVTPRYHHIRYNDYERYEVWHKSVAVATSLSLLDIVESAIEHSGVGFVYDDMSEYAADLGTQLAVVERLRELRGLPIPEELRQARALLGDAETSWMASQDAASQEGGGAYSKEMLDQSIDAAVEAQKLAGDALLAMCPALRGDAVAGKGPDLQWSQAALADLQRPDDLPADVAGDEELLSNGVRVRGVAEWRLELARAYEGMERGAAARLLRRTRPTGDTARRAFDEHVSGASGRRSRVDAALRLTNLGTTAAEGQEDGRVAGPGGAGATLSLGDRARAFDRAARGDAWSRKQRDDIVAEVGSAMQPWQPRKVAGRLSDAAPAHLASTARALEGSSRLTAGERARLLQEAANRMDQAQDIASRELQPGDLSRMEGEWARPAQRLLEKPWEMRFPVNTRSPNSGRKADSDLFQGGRRPEERDVRFPDGAEHDAVHGAANPTIADLSAAGTAVPNAAALSSYHSFLSSISKQGERR